jgi:hypothetical protein
MMSVSGSSRVAEKRIEAGPQGRPRPVWRRRLADLSRVAPGLRFAPCSRSAFGGPLTGLAGLASCHRDATDEMIRTERLWTLGWGDQGERTDANCYKPKRVPCKAPYVSSILTAASSRHPSTRARFRGASLRPLSLCATPTPTLRHPCGLRRTALRNCSPNYTVEKGNDLLAAFALPGLFQPWHDAYISTPTWQRST